jgi:hypothetical protein
MNNNNNIAFAYLQPIPIVLKIRVPSQNLIKTIRIITNESIWTLKKIIMNKITSEVKDAYNYGLFEKKGIGANTIGKFLDEDKMIGFYNLSAESNIDFIPKQRLIVGPMQEEDVNNKKKQKKFLEDVTKANYEKVKERLIKGQDPNFLSDTGESPLSMIKN